MMVRALLFAVLLAGLVPAGARAAAPWSPPESVSSPALFVDGPQIAIDTAGRAYALWRPAGGHRFAVRDPGAIEFGPERAAPSFVTPLLAHGVGRLLGLDARERGARMSLRARFSRPDGTFGPPDTIATYVAAGGGPALAVHDVALAAWTQRGSRGRRIVRAAIRRSRRGFGPAVTLRAGGRARDVVAGAGPGVVFVAWERAGIVEARVRAVGRGWGPVRRLGRAAKASTTFRALFNGRRGYLAWLAESAESATLRAAVLPTARTRFRDSQTVDTIDRVPPEPHPPAIVPIAQRGALLAWTDWDGATWRVRAAVTNGAGARFAGPFHASPAGEPAVLGDAESIPPGTIIPAATVMVVWSRLNAVGELGDRVRASVRPPGGFFGAPEDVSDLDRARLPDVAFDATALRWTAVWSQRIGPDQGVPQSQITTFLRAATRPG